MSLQCRTKHSMHCQTCATLCSIRSWVYNEGRKKYASSDLINLMQHQILSLQCRPKTVCIIRLVQHQIMSLQCRTKNSMHHQTCTTLWRIRSWVYNAGYKIQWSMHCKTCATLCSIRSWVNNAGHKIVCIIRLVQPCAASDHECKMQDTK